MTGTENQRAWALFFARAVLGLMFFMAGVHKVFQMGALTHARDWFVVPYAETFLPIWALWAVGTVIPFVELSAGALVLLGLRTRYALIALGFDLAVVTFGHLLMEPFYQLQIHVLPRLALILFVLMVSQEDDRFSLDRLLAKAQNH